ncbi:multicopper oxidase domain-containing protein [Motilibacter aurantiacus]|uniref:multicopper oxidase domain-containing protein n=1 Tax=Motilibacter aurantiacus TaxID=2714955 RepID=UPI00140D5DCE|nr:multicopper oxidase domain-containing protein [Motilibacter aurantiacus]NHC47409.1 multicopper oxidase domain-containing protein [Motilibacter aurantiacus]
MPTSPLENAPRSGAAAAEAGEGNLLPRRRLLIGGLAGTAAAAVVLRPGLATGDDSAPASLGTVPRAGAGGTVREVTLYAVAGPGTRLAYGTTPENASIPGPTLEAIEGDELRVTLINTTTETVSLHAHGVDVPAADDGTPASGSVVAPGAQHTYVWRTHGPTQRADGTWEPGSAGYWHYHDHAVGSVHGTGGITRGLYGALVVRRPGDPLPEKQFVTFFNELTINNSAVPDSVNYSANLGQRVEWIMVTHGVASFHTFHAHAHRWADNRLGILSGDDDGTAVIDNRTTGPGESFGFQIIAGEHVGPGTWMYHCHVQFHSDGGMIGIFTVNNADGTPPPGHEEHMGNHRQMAAEMMSGGGHAHAHADAPTSVKDVTAGSVTDETAHAGHGS